MSLSLSVMQLVIGVTGYTWDTPSPISLGWMSLLLAMLITLRSLRYVLPFPWEFLPTIGNSLQLIGDECFARFGALVVNN